MWAAREIHGTKRLRWTLDSDLFLIGALSPRANPNLSLVTVPRLWGQPEASRAQRAGRVVLYGQSGLLFSSRWTYLLCVCVFIMEYLLTLDFNDNTMLHQPNLIIILPISAYSIYINNRNESSHYKHPRPCVCEHTLACLCQINRCRRLRQSHLEGTIILSTSLAALTLWATITVTTDKLPSWTHHRQGWWPGWLLIEVAFMALQSDKTLNQADTQSGKHGNRLSECTHIIHIVCAVYKTEHTTSICLVRFTLPRPALACQFVCVCVCLRLWRNPLLILTLLSIDYSKGPFDSPIGHVCENV